MGSEGKERMRKGVGVGTGVLGVVCGHGRLGRHVRAQARASCGSYSLSLLYSIQRLSGF